MYNEFDIENPEIDLLEITDDNCNDDYIQEANIKASDLGAPGDKKKKPRNIIITGSGSSQHNGRMKVSKWGIAISRSTGHDDYISIYSKGKGKINYDGNLKSIDMSSEEFKFYEELFKRNQTLIQLVKTGNGRYDQYIDKAIINDENKRRIDGLKVERDENGIASIYKLDKDGEYQLQFQEDIKGERIDVRKNNSGRSCKS